MSQGGEQRDVVRVFGAGASHARAGELARQVHELLFAYAREVVAAFKLCPFLHNVDTGMGAVGVVLEKKPQVETAVAAMLALDTQVVHMAFPLFEGGSSDFERFGNRFAEALRRALPSPLVHASFHPALVGGTENPHRLIGLLRQAPDPFVQFIPPGLASGGTVLAGDAQADVDHAGARFERLKGPALEAVLARVESLKSQRETRYGALAREIAATLNA